MSAPIDPLLQLQQIDSALYRMKVELDELARVAAESRAIVEDKRPVVLARRHEMAQMERRRKEIETRLADDEQRMKDSRMRMQRIRNEKELGALRREIELTKEQNSALEDELLSILEIGDGKTSELKVLEDDLAVVEAKLREGEQNHAQRSAEFREETERLTAEREALAATLDDNLRRRYELILARKGGLAVVEIRDGDCSGCRMRVPPQLITQVHRNSDVVFCPSCQRILFYPPSAATEKAPTA